MGDAEVIADATQRIGGALLPPGATTVAAFSNGWTLRDERFAWSEPCEGAPAPGLNQEPCE